MLKHHIFSMIDSDAFFAQEGAVGYFDTHFPKTEWSTGPMIFRRHYFNKEELYMGNYIPQFWQMGSHCSVHFNPEPLPYLHTHPGLKPIQNL